MQKLEEALKLRQEGHYQQSNEILVNLVEEYPENASLHYQCAWSFDLLGEEAKAAPYYEKAIQSGLGEEELKGAYIGLGSTYRTLGEYEKSKDVLQEGMARYPENRAIQVFYAMTLYNMNEHHRSMELLLQCLADTTRDEELAKYKKALQFYSDKLDQVWK